MVNLSFIPASIAGILGLLLILSFVIKPLKGFRVAVSGFAGKYANLVAVAMIVLLLAFAGGSAWLGSQWHNIAGGTLATGSLMGNNNVVSASAITELDCRLNTFTKATAPYATGITFRADPNMLNHYYADVLHNNGTSSMNGTLTCTRIGDIEKAGSVTIYVKADSFRSETSTSDANVYYILATSASASKVSGFPWAQTAYVNDGSVATTSSDVELTEVVFTGGSSAQAVETVGYYFTLPGATIFGYLNNQTSKDVKFYAKVNGVDKEIAKLTITKVSA